MAGLAREEAKADWTNCYVLYCKWEGSRPAERMASPSGMLSGGYDYEQSSVLQKKIQNPLCSYDLLIHHQHCPAYNLPWAICPSPFTDHMSEIMTPGMYSVQKPKGNVSPFFALDS